MPVAAWGQGVHYDGVAGGPRGPIANPTVTVCTSAGQGTPCTPLAATAAAGQPFTNQALTVAAVNPLPVVAIGAVSTGAGVDALGNYGFWAQPGTHVRISITGPGVATPVLQDVTIPCDATQGCTSTGAATFTGTVTAGNINNTIVLDGTKFAQTDAGFSSALTAAGTNGTVVIPANVTVSLTTAHTITTSGLTIRCERNAGFLTSPVGNAAFTVQGLNDFQVTGCTFTWSSGTTCAIVMQNTINRAEIDHNVFVNYPGGGCNTSLFVGDRSNSSIALGLSDINIHDNQFRGFAGNGIISNDVISKLSIVNNKFNTATTATNVQSINIFDQDNSTPMNGIVITGNQIVNATNGSCITVQLPLGTTSTIAGVAVAANNCFAGTNNAGGYSMSGIAGLVEVGNTFNTTYQGTTYNYGPSNTVNAFEFADINNAVEIGDNAIIGTQSFTGQFPVFTISVNTGRTANNNLFANNNATFAFTGTGIMSCFIASAGNATTTMSRNSIINNTCDLTGSSGTGNPNGIALTATNNTATMQFNTVSGNTLIGPATANDDGIVVQKSGTPTMTHNFVGPNTVANWTNPYMNQLNSGTAGFCGGCVDSTTATTLTIGAVGIAGQVLLNGSTSGTVTLAAPAVAGTLTNPITSTNTLSAPLVLANQGAICTNGELALSAGWQSTGSATVTAVAGNGQTCSWTITTGTTTAANPTITDTLTNALPAATTRCWMFLEYGPASTHTAAAGEGFAQTTLSATAPIFTFNGTPTAAGKTYLVVRTCGP